MRGGIAVVAITRQGARLGARLTAALADSRLYVAARFASEAAAALEEAGVAAREAAPGGSAGGEAAAGADEGSRRRLIPVSEPAGALLARLFPACRGLVLLFSLGAAVRLLAPLVRDKRTDPAVVVVDDAGRFAIAALSGHLGGANELAERVAAALGAQPVITTASDVHGTLAVDLLGRRWGWRVEGEEAVTRVSAAVVNGDPVGIYQDAGETGWWSPGRPLPAHLTVHATLADLVAASPAAALVITDRLVADEVAPLAGRCLVYRPRTLAVGVGCNRGTTAEEIVAAVRDVLRAHGLSPLSLHHLGTVEAKRDEAGLAEAARRLDCPLCFHPAARLDAVAAAAGLAPSAAALRHVGARGVCEPAALLGAAGGPLLVPKQRCGNVTVAVARRVCCEEGER